MQSNILKNTSQRKLESSRNKKQTERIDDVFKQRNLSEELPMDTSVRYLIARDIRRGLVHLSDSGWER